ncbi:hypothetical protein ACJIZ3_014418 [Penstemon smallii]|uniref:Uncharacterized protein n=1 Tax=Penstemon smallii TaxID=265156 RepID=A0ABD3RUH1_9LAMI
METHNSSETIFRANKVDLPSCQPVNNTIKKYSSSKSNKSIRRGILTFGFGYIEFAMGSNEFRRFDEGFPCFAHGCESHQGFHRSPEVLLEYSR